MNGSKTFTHRGTQQCQSPFLISNIMNSNTLPSSNSLLQPSAPIGVFDSGIGGLTVVAALQKLLPHENILYIGDTARVPYGGKSQETVMRYSQEIVDLLLQRGSKLAVAACNTASALAVPTLKNFYAIPLHGVIESGAAAAIKTTRSGKIGVIGTKATIRSNAYHQAIDVLDPHLTIISQACPLLVPLIEEGWIEDEITDSILHRYLDPILSQGIDTLVLGCTHYPLLKKRIATIVGPEITLVDSAENCALDIKSLLAEKNLATTNKDKGNLNIILTDRSEGFLNLAAERLHLIADSLETISFH
ncbi:MAG: glutamate racemase [Chthoniobacterales bacterium]|nr:glutamate racemase [Chthoniobacterales bacterium]